MMGVDDRQDIAISQLAGWCAELAELVAQTNPDQAGRARELSGHIQHVADHTLAHRQERQTEDSRTAARWSAAHRIHRRRGVLHRLVWHGPACCMGRALDTLDQTATDRQKAQP